MKKLSILFLTTALTACNLAPDYERPVIETSSNWKGAAAVENAEIPQDWWKKFGSDDLTGLVDESIKANTDIEAGIQRVEQARASAKVASANLYPSADLSGNISRTQVSRNSNNIGGNNGTTRTNSYSVGASVNYEVDLFGRNRANSNAAEERLKASRYDLDALKLIIASDTARAYAQLLATDDRIKAAKANLETARGIMKITQARYDEGRIAGLELAQQKTALATTEASIASLEQGRKNIENQLAVLTGKAPQDFTIAPKTLTGFTVPAIAPYQPSLLLERRPDIKTAEADLIAANIDIGAARADYFPSLQIGLDAGLAASPLSDPATRTLGLAGSVLAPIFSGGAIEGNVERTKARKEELVANYKGIVLVSFREVQDALVAVKATEKRLAEFEIAMNQSQKAYDIAATQYKEGDIDFQNLLNTQSALFQTQDSYAQARFEQISAAIDLYKALGGGWKEAADN